MSPLCVTLNKTQKKKICVAFLFKELYIFGENGCIRSTAAFRSSMSQRRTGDDGVRVHVWFADQCQENRSLHLDAPIIVLGCVFYFPSGNDGVSIAAHPAGCSLTLSSVNDTTFLSVFRAMHHA